MVPLMVILIQLYQVAQFRILMFGQTGQLRQIFQALEQEHIQLQLQMLIVAMLLKQKA